MAYLPRLVVCVFEALCTHRGPPGTVRLCYFYQSCGSGSQLDPDSIGSVDPDLKSGIIKISCFEVLEGLF
jgi:hypothetical protein